MVTVVDLDYRKEYEKCKKTVARLKDALSNKYTDEDVICMVQKELLTKGMYDVLQHPELAEKIAGSVLKTNLRLDGRSDFSLRNFPRSKT